MTQKQVSQLDADGYFIHPVNADLSPLEPGVFLIPADAVDAPPPEIPQEQRAKWGGDAWLFEDIPPPSPEPEAEPEPEPGVPQSVTMRQARLALLGAGLLDAVNAAIAGMASVEGKAAQIEWEFAQEVRRDNPLFAALSAQMGLSDAQLDELFIAGAAL
ncbi:MAG: hypothetical protein LBJ59_08785 [Zoogloeaceae bacterium]|jgi:hypothetical protein|nr:hypothetical protein [Zoogloeaceae bacterium]